MAGASMNDIKARIKSVEGTMQITKAMELVATSKLRHAKAKAENSKPYMKTLFEAISMLASGLPAGECEYTYRRSGKTLYIVIAGDRGLAGGYNSNIAKIADSLSKESEGIFLPIGKKAGDYASKRSLTIFSNAFPITAGVGVGDCMKMAESICDAYKCGEFTSVKIIYTKFVSMLSQVPEVKELLPLKSDEKATMPEPIYEGDINELIDNIVPKYIGGFLHAAICEALASECAARRTAMNSANKNAEEMIGSLVLKFNRARQTVITQEITEIVSGAEAL